MKIQQFVMAYEVEQDRLRALLPAGFSSLRPVLRINAEVRDGRSGYAELNTAVEKGGVRGWLNIGCWDDVPFSQTGSTTVFRTPHLTISFTGTGIEGSCPAEKDNDGCFFTGASETLRKPEIIRANKEFCDCRFAWHFHPGDACGQSIGKTLPAYPTEVRTVYPREALTPENAARLPCLQVLGAYCVCLDRQR